jgi:hypothetical protein
MARRWKRWGILAVAILAAVLGVAGWRSWYAGQPFDPAAWQDPARVEQGVRLGMADRLVVRGTLRGKTRAEVIELLEEPTETGKFSDWDLVYWLGPERGFISIDSEWLVLRFGPEGRVTECRMVRD